MPDDFTHQRETPWGLKGKETISLRNEATRGNEGKQKNTKIAAAILCINIVLYSSWLVDVNSHCQIREANFLTEFCYLLATEAGLDLRKKTLGPAGSYVFRFGRQTFSALLAGNFHLKFPQYKLSTPPSLQHEGK